jgi:hypothetical protein
VNRAALNGASRTHGACRKTGRVTKIPLIRLSPGLLHTCSNARSEGMAGRPAEAIALGGAPTTKIVKKDAQP